MYICLISKLKYHEKYDYYISVDIDIVLGRGLDATNLDPEVQVDVRRNHDVPKEKDPKKKANRNDFQSLCVY